MGEKLSSFVYFDEQGLHVGSRLYIGNDLSLEDVFGVRSDDGTKMYDKRYATKIKHYPNGYWKRVYCNNYKFRVALYGANKSYTAYKDESDASEGDSCEDDYDVTLVADDRNRDDNYKRAKDRIFEIIFCNMSDFQVFVTVTFDDDKVDSRDPVAVITKLRNWLSHMVQRKGLKYLLVPEYHKSGRIHAHLLCNNVFNLVDSGTRVVEGFDKPIKLSTIARYNIHPSRIKGIVYNITDWKCGFSTAELTYGDGAALANYVLKEYMTKDNRKIFGKHYWCSRNIIMYPIVELVDDNPYLFSRYNLPVYRSWWSDDEYKYDDNIKKRIY